MRHPTVVVTMAVLSLSLMACSNANQTSPAPSPTPSIPLTSVTQAASAVAQHRPAIMMLLEQQISNTCPGILHCTAAQENADNWNKTLLEAKKMSDALESLRPFAPEIASLVGDTIEVVSDGVEVFGVLLGCYGRSPDRFACKAEEAAVAEALATFTQPGELHRIMLAWEPYL